MSKALNKIKNCVEEGNYYEAHQMLVSVSQRLIKQNKTEEAFNLLQQGILTMLSAQQWTSALDIAERLINFLGNKSSDDSRGDYFNINFRSAPFFILRISHQGTML